MSLTDDARDNGRHPGTVQILRWFDYKHLPAGPMRQTSARCAELAAAMLELPDGPELTAGLRQLLIAKDCFVRAALDAA